jgi:pheromone shutdown protein TraB
MKENTIFVTIELTGIAKSIAGHSQVKLEISASATYHDVVFELARLYPDLVNILIDADRRNFLSSNLFIINDEMTDPVFLMEQHPRNGDKLTLLSVMTGG